MAYLAEFRVEAPSRFWRYEPFFELILKGDNPNLEIAAVFDLNLVIVDVLGLVGDAAKYLMAFSLFVYKTFYCVVLIRKLDVITPFFGWVKLDVEELGFWWDR